MAELVGRLLAALGYPTLEWVPSWAGLAWSVPLGLVLLLSVAAAMQSSAVDRADEEPEWRREIGRRRPAA